jgi:hypothetical protein
MLEWFSDYFYDPVIFWGVPLALALVWAGIRHARAWFCRHRSATD